MQNTNQNRIRKTGSPCFFQPRYNVELFEIPSPISDRFPKECRYHGFDYKKLSSTHNLSPNERNTLDALLVYLKPFQTYSLYENIGYNDLYSVINDVLSLLCKNCGSLDSIKGECKEFFHEICVELKMNETKLCTMASSKYAFDRCLACRKNSRKGEDWKGIRVRDIRFWGHPVLIYIQYPYKRCKAIDDLLHHIPGIREESGFNQVRYSIRISEVINDALGRKVSYSYLSEGTGVPLSTIQKWQKKELEKCCIENQKAITRDYLMEYRNSYQTQLLQITMKHRFIDFPVRVYNENQDGSKPDRIFTAHLHTAFKSVCTLFYELYKTSNSKSFRTKARENHGDIPLYHYDDLLDNVLSRLPEMDPYPLCNLLFDVFSYVGTMDHRAFVSGILNRYGNLISGDADAMSVNFGARAEAARSFSRGVTDF